MSCGFCEAASSNSVGTLLVDWIAKPLKTEFDYMRHFRKNVTDLTEKKEKLQSAKERLGHDIEEAENQLLEIERDIRSLEDKVKEKLKEMSSQETKTQQNKKCFNLCPNWWWRCRLSRGLEKKTLPSVSELLEEIARHCNPQRLGYPAAITPAVEWRPLGENFQDSKASYKAFNHLKDALRDDNVSMIGLWGMGGVGKTTLVKEVGNQARTNLFGKVVFATVSSDPNFEKIQDEIAKQLRFSMIQDGVRRSTTDLWMRLEKETSILIILDDVWVELDLENKVGIPVGKDGFKGCKVILTTRLHRVCQSMKCQSKIELGYLDQHEAWELFQKKATLENCSDEYIKKKAGKITNKCQGLPIAIVTLASALNGEKSHDVWKAAYRRLKHHKLDVIEGIENTREKNAYLCLQMSFDYLKSRETKICFLLCSLFPEDYEIYIEDLVRYAWGLKIYKCMTIKKARSEVLAAIGTLKNSCLLLDAKKNHVKLHDMIRDVALWISFKDRDISFMIKSKIIKTWSEDEFQSCKAISLVTSDQRVQLPDYMVCPHLEILLLGGKGFKFASIPSKFFERMQTLKVFSLHDSKISMDAFGGESETSNLQIRSLHFEWCELSTISSLKKLKQLEILSFNRCEIVELPDEIGDLNNLRILDLAECESLSRIPPHLISRLSKLEELYLDGCTAISWANDQDAAVQENCASLSELSSLTGSIKTLTLEVSFEDVPKNFVFPDLEQFDICVDKETVGSSILYNFEGSLSRSLRVEGSALHACKNLLRDLELFALKKLEGYQNLVPSFVSDHGVDLNKLTRLDLKSCEHMKYLVDVTKQEMIATTAFSDLEKLKLSEMYDLEELCNGPQPQGFLQNLKALRIFYCHTLRYIFPASVAKSLFRLEELEIYGCQELEEIIQKTEASNVCLQSLKRVDVGGCNKLKSLSSLCNGQNLEKLESLVIDRCYELEYTFPTSLGERLPQLKFCRLADLSKLKGNDIVFTLPSLEELEVIHSPLYPPSIISVKLQEQSENRTGNEASEISTDDVVNHLFDSRYDHSRLRILKLSDASELQVIWKDPIQVRNFQSLSELNIYSCQKLRQVFSTATVQNLMSLTIDGCAELRQVFSTATVQNLPQLRFLTIKGCAKLEQIITNKGETSSQDHLQRISFPSLERVLTERCSKLKSVFPISVAHGLPKLERLYINESSSLEQVFEHEEEVAVNLLHEHKMISLPRLKSLFLKGLPRLVSFLPIDYGFDVILPSLRELEVNMLKLKSLSSLYHGQNLKKLETLVIDRCDELEYTFPTSMAERLPQLKFCRLVDLSKLKGNDIVFTLPSLEILEVRHCPLYTSSIISAKLQEQSENRKGNEASEIPTDDVVNHLFDSRYDHSRLRKLELSKASELQVIWKDPILVRNFQSLSELNIRQCQNLRQVFSTATVLGLPQLRSLEIIDCAELEQIITNKGETSSQDHLQPIRFPSLKSIRIRGCSKLKSVFPISVAHGLPELEFLFIKDNSNLQQVFEQEEKAAVNLLDEHKMISLPRLNYLVLEGLPRLVSFLPMDYGSDVILPSLGILEVNNCPDIATSFSVDSKNCGHIRNKTEPNPSVDNYTAQELAISQRTWPIGSDIIWDTWTYMNT